MSWQLAAREYGNHPVRIDDLAPEFVDRLHRFMLRLRRCEEKLIEEYRVANEMRCPVHFCIGQEAAPAAVSVMARLDDYVFCHHRSHGYFLAKHSSMRPLIAELFGRQTGANGGLAGSQEISLPEANFYSGAILTGAVSIGVGTAMALRAQGTGAVAFLGFGEGATDEGVFWEAVNLAALRRLPAVFVCENNGYATFSPQAKRQATDQLCHKVAAFGVPAQTVFGNDAPAVHRAVKAATERARRGEGPSFIETYTYRWNAHVGPESDDAAGYRTEAEIAGWKSLCPIRLLENAMRPAGLLDDERRARLEAEIAAEIQDALDFARSSPFPTVTDWQPLNYSRSSPLADALLAEPVADGFDQNQADALPGPY
jgi:acetoin:2,6-dichlorophenolindophenol oxidoreductase subunit alpha